MQTIGLLGGMSWESTAEYYRILNEETKKRLGGLSSAKLVLHSVNFAELEPSIQEQDWPALAAHLSWQGHLLQRAGADFVVICTNTMHRVADEVAAGANLPVVHIGDVTADAVVQAGLQCVGLLGTKATMECDFISGKLNERGVNSVVPNEVDRELVHKVIFEELCMGEVRKESKSEYLRIMEELKQQGAEGIILGCTEIPLLVKPEDFDLPLFDTTEIHALAALDRAIGEE